MGAILKIRDNDIGRPVAMKVILEPDDSERVERFVEEAQITGQLEHPNIVPVHEIGVTPDGRAYFTMKLVKGRSLESIVQGISSGDASTRGLYPLAALLRIFTKVCDAVAFAHSCGVIHRDLKPENVMVGEFGEVQVMDWGLAKVIARRGRQAAEPVEAFRKIEVGPPAGPMPDGPGARPGLERADGAGGRTEINPGKDTVRTIRSHDDGIRTLDGAIMGTPSYMSPEQADGRLDEIDERSDVFALGGILYTLLVHEPLYTGATAMNMVTKAARAEFVPLSERAKGARVPPELESVCMKALQLDKADRYSSVADFSADIQAYLDHRLVRAH